MLNKKSGKSARVLLAAVLAAAVLCGCGSQPVETAPAEETKPIQTTEVVKVTEAAIPVLTVESIAELEEAVLVSTSYCDVKFPFAFADLIHVKAVNEEPIASLEFVLQLSGEEYPLFAVRFGGNDGILMGTMRIANEAEPRSVYAVIYSANESALGESVNTYFAAQESFNDVVMSLMENEGFTPAQ